MKNIKVYLDDVRETPAGWVRTYTAPETIELLKNNLVTELSLDHDLGYEISSKNVKGLVVLAREKKESLTGNGYDVILWIEKRVATTDYVPPIIHIHTSNPPARAKMEAGVRMIQRLLKARNEP